MKDLRKKTTVEDRIVDKTATNPENELTEKTNEDKSSTGTQQRKMEEDTTTIIQRGLETHHDSVGETATELYRERPCDTSGVGVSAPGIMDLSQLQFMYGENYGVSGYKIMQAKNHLIMPPQIPLIEWLNNCDNPAFSIVNLVSQGTELLKRDMAGYNSLMSVFAYQGAEWSIHLGNILLKLKILVRKSGSMWGVWLVNNLPFMTERTMEKMMRLARRKDCRKYAILGTERLDILCAAIPESKDGSDAIGSFLARHEIVFDPTHEFNLEEFKRQIDYALANEKLGKKGLIIPAGKVAALVDNGCPIDGALLKEFQAIHRSGGDLGSHVDYLITSGGKGSSEKSPEQRLQDVNHLAERLTKSIDLILSKQDLIDMIDRDIYRRLLEKLNDINILRDMATDCKPVAA